MGKHILSYQHNGTLFSVKNEVTIDTHKNMNESQNNYAELKKPDRKINTV